MGRVETEFVTSSADAGQTLSAILRARMGLTWNAARALCERGKVTVDGQRRLDGAVRVRSGWKVAVNPQAPRPLSKRTVQVFATEAGTVWNPSKRPRYSTSLPRSSSNTSQIVRSG